MVWKDFEMQQQYFDKKNILLFFLSKYYVIKILSVTRTSREKEIFYQKWFTKDDDVEDLVDVNLLEDGDDGDGIDGGDQGGEEQGV